MKQTAKLTGSALLDTPAKRLQEIADGAGFDDIYGIVWPHEHGIVRRDLKAILASLSASNAMRDAQAVVDAVAHTRLQWFCSGHDCTDYDAGRDEGLQLAEDAARAALAGQGNTLDRQTVEACKRAVRDRMVEQEWPPTDGDRQIDEILEALDDLIEARASMDQSHVR